MTLLSWLILAITDEAARQCDQIMWCRGVRRYQYDLERLWKRAAEARGEIEKEWGWP